MIIFGICGFLSSFLNLYLRETLSQDTISNIRELLINND